MFSSRRLSLRSRRRNTNILYITNCDDLWLFNKNTKLTKEREKTLKTISSRFRAKPPRNRKSNWQFEVKCSATSLPPSIGRWQQSQKTKKTHTPIQNDTHTLTVELMNPPSNTSHQSQSIKETEIRELHPNASKAGSFPPTKLTEAQSRSWPWSDTFGCWNVEVTCHEGPSHLRRGLSPLSRRIPAHPRPSV